MRVETVKIRILCLLSFLSLSVLRADELVQVVKSAMQTSWEIENAKLNAESAEGLSLNSRTSLLPALSGSVKYGVQGGSPAPADQP